ncbi:MAG: hypothetical protein QM747_17170 [Nocardioides sp.]
MQDNAYLSNHPPVLTVNGIPQSLAQLRAVQEAIRRINSKTVTITTRHATGGRSMHTGGFTGWGDKYEPRGVVHAGEVVIPKELVVRDWAELKSRYGYLPGFHEGGLVGMSSGGAGRAAGGMSVSIDSGPMHMTGTLDTPWGPAQVRGIAISAAQDVYDANHALDMQYAGKRARQ